MAAIGTCGETRRGRNEPDARTCPAHQASAASRHMRDVPWPIRLDGMPAIGWA